MNINVQHFTRKNMKILTTMLDKDNKFDPNLIHSYSRATIYKCLSENAIECDFEEISYADDRAKEELKLFLHVEKDGSYSYYQLSSYGNQFKKIMEANQDNIFLNDLLDKHQNKSRESIFAIYFKLQKVYAREYMYNVDDIKKEFKNYFTKSFSTWFDDQCNKGLLRPLRYHKITLERLEKSLKKTHPDLNIDAVANLLKNNDRSFVQVHKDVEKGISIISSLTRLYDKNLHPEEYMTKVLHESFSIMDDLEGIGIASVDGLPIGVTIPPEWGDMTICALTALLISMSERVIAEAKMLGHKYTMITSETHTIVISPIDMEHILFMVLSSKNDPVQHVQYLIQDRSEIELVISHKQIPINHMELFTPFPLRYHDVNARISYMLPILNSTGDRWIERIEGHDYIKTIIYTHDGLVYTHKSDFDDGLWEVGVIFKESNPIQTTTQNIDKKLHDHPESEVCMRSKALLEKYEKRLEYIDNNISRVVDKLRNIL